MYKARSIFLIGVILTSIGSLQARILFSTIDTPGFYKLADTLNNSVTITVSDVTFDLGGHAITASNGIIINNNLNQIVIKNGVINASNDGIMVNGGCTNITLQDITITNAIRGINFENATAGSIKHCEMTQNTTGLELTNSHKINVIDCVASCNTNAGYSLVSSTTNYFENCRALSTGEGNFSTENATIFGFVSQDGYGNIFERCIANSTQGLTVTDSNSLIAGFALRGTEKGSKIIDSESANSMTSADGFTVPYGIFIEGTIDSTMSVTGITSTNVYWVNWSPNGQYVAVAGISSGGTGDEFQIFSFDGIAASLAVVAGALGSTGTGLAMNWDPTGQYLAIVGNVIMGGGFQVLKFDREGTLMSVASGIEASVIALATDWTPDGQYIAIGNANLGAGNDLQIFRFDRAANALISITGALEGNITAVNWSPDGQYVAVGGDSITGGTGDHFQIFSFDRAAGTLTSVTGALGTTCFIYSVNWSPDGQYVAIGGEAITAGTGDQFQIFRFDRAAGTLTSVAGALGASSFILSVDWSADGQYVAVGGGGITGDQFQVFRFDRSSAILSSVMGALGSGSVLSVSWSPDGQYIALVGSGIPGDDFQIFTGLQFPKKNVIKNNTVYCNSGNQFPGGVGISGSSIANMIIDNTSYSNPIARAANAPIVSSNYQFVTNIFNPLFGLAPSDIQNIALAGCAPISFPDDFLGRIKRVERLFESLIDNLL